MTDFQIINATVEHVDGLVPLLIQVQELHVEGFPARFRTMSTESAHEFFALSLGRTDARIFLASTAERVIGYILVETKESEGNTFCHPWRVARVDQICIDHNFRKQGIARALLVAAEEWARSLGFSRLELDTWEFNKGALNAFRGLGFLEYNIRLSREIEGM